MCYNNKYFAQSTLLFSRKLNLLSFVVLIIYINVLFFFFEKHRCIFCSWFRNDVLYTVLYAQFYFKILYFHIKNTKWHYINTLLFSKLHNRLGILFWNSRIFMLHFMSYSWARTSFKTIKVAYFIVVFVVIIVVAIVVQRES